MSKANLIAKGIVLIFSSAILVASFQNCAQPSNGSAFLPEVSGSGIQQENTQQELSPEFQLVDASSLDLSLKSLYSDGSRKLNVKDIVNLRINLENGEMRHVNVDGIYTSPERLCLSQQELSEFKSVLKKVRVCQNHQTVGNEVVCTQIYRSPFAKFRFNGGKTLHLGEVSGCEKSSDLCEDDKEIFNGFITYLRSHIDTRRCL